MAHGRLGRVLWRHRPYQLKEERLDYVGYVFNALRCFENASCMFEVELPVSDGGAQSERFIATKRDGRTSIVEAQVWWRYGTS